MCVETRAHSAARSGQEKNKKRRALLDDKTRGGVEGRCALNARWTDRHRFGTRQADVVDDTRPIGIRDVKHERCSDVESENDLVGAAEVGVARLLLALGFPRGLGKMAEFARFAAVEGHIERLGRGHHLRVVMKHLRPRHQLHHVPHRAVGTKPGEDQG